ncbi:MAG: hypothetical protein ABJN65_09425 [Parasphingorhabdus sp.]
MAPTPAFISFPAFGRNSLTVVVAAGLASASRLVAYDDVAQTVH